MESTNVNVWFTSVIVKKNSPDPTRDRENIGAGGGARTRTVITPRDFKSLVSAIPPHRQTASIYYHVRCAPSSKIRARAGNRKDLLS